MAELASILTGGSADWAQNAADRFADAFEQLTQELDIPMYLDAAEVSSGGMFTRKALVTYLCLVRNGSSHIGQSTPPPAAAAAVGRPDSPWSSPELGDAPGLAAMTSNSPSALLSPDASAEEIKTMGYMRLKKWLVAQGVEARTVSQCMSYEELLELADFNGFITLGKTPQEVGGAAEIYRDNTLGTEQYSSVNKHVCRSHASNKPHSQLTTRVVEKDQLISSLSPKR